MEDASDYEKIGAKCLKVRTKAGRLVFDRDGVLYDMAPAALTDFALDPLVIGADRMVLLGAKLKGWDGAASFNVLYSESYLPMADAVLALREPKFNGWIYSVEGLNLPGLMPGQCAWVCHYMGLFFSDPPRTLYLKMELQHEG